DRLPKTLIHRNVPGEPIHAFLRDWDHAWAVCAPYGSHGARQRWLAAAETLAASWPIVRRPPFGGRARWRLGELTVAWQAVDPTGSPTRGTGTGAPGRRCRPDRPAGTLGSRRGHRAASKTAYALASKSTNRASVTAASQARTASIATRAPSASGQPKMPVPIAGKATVRAPSDSATRSDCR